MLRSELVVDLETEVVRTLLGLEVSAAELLVAGNTPVVVHLVLDFNAGAPVLGGVHVGLQVRGIRKLVVSTKLNTDWETLESLGTISSIVGHFNSVGAAIAVLMMVTSAHEMLVQVSTHEIAVLSIFGSPGSLSPELLEILHVVFEEDAQMVLILVCEVQAELHLSLVFVVVFDVFL